MSHVIVELSTVDGKYHYSDAFTEKQMADEGMSFDEAVEKLEDLLANMYRLDYFKMTSEKGKDFFFNPKNVVFARLMKYV